MVRILKTVLIIILLLPSQTLAQGVATIRDDETEKYLREISYPVFDAAGLYSDGIKLIIVNSPVLNAFVAGGQNMFIHTGLIVESDDPSLLIGVMAHEAGHIRGGHIIKKTENISEAGIKSAIGYVLGAASVAVGAPPIAGAVFGSAGQHAAVRGFLKHSREYEEAADQAAIDILSKTGISPNGLITLLEKLGSDQRAFIGDVNPYIQTHPLSVERVNHLKAAIQSKPELDKPTDEKLLAKHHRIIAKLRAFLGDPQDVLKRYDKDTIPARYARAVAYYRIPDIKKALMEIDSLIEEFPDDPYFHELRGQMLFENGYIKESVESYKKEMELTPDATMARLQLGTAQIAIENYEGAIQNLKQVVLQEPKNSFAWHQLAIAQGRINNLGDSYFALAEEAALKGNKDDVTKYIALAKKNLAEGSNTIIREKDIMATLKEITGEEK